MPVQCRAARGRTIARTRQSRYAAGSAARLRGAPRECSPLLATSPPMCCCPSRMRAWRLCSNHRGATRGGFVWIGFGFGRGTARRRTIVSLVRYTCRSQCGTISSRGNFNVWQPPKFGNVPRVHNLEIAGMNTWNTQDKMVGCQRYRYYGTMDEAHQAAPMPQLLPYFASGQATAAAATSQWQRCLGRCFVWGGGMIGSKSNSSFAVSTFRK